MTLHEWLAQWSEWGLPLLANHLWQATLFSALCILAVLLLKEGPSRTRHMIWLIAGLKFAIPSAMVVFLMECAGLHLAGWSHSPLDGANGLASVGQFTAPVYQWSDSAVSASASSGHNELYCGLTLAWLSGVAILLALWVSRRLQFSRSVRAGRGLISWRETNALHRALGLLGVAGDVDLIVSSGVSEPGVWRVFRPTIVLPVGMADDLSDPELETVLLHELIHIARRDNLIGNLHMMVCCTLWFHPLTWIIDAKLLNERERACDEAVIKLAGGSDAYASSLLKVLRFCLGWKVAGVSQAAGSNLRKRVEIIMSNYKERKLSISHRVVVGTVAALVVAFTIAVGFVSRDQAAAQENLPQVNSRQEGTPQLAEGTATTPNNHRGEVTEAAITVQSSDTRPESIIQYRNAEGSPVAITGASAKFFKLEKLNTAAPTRRYFVNPNLSLVNNSDQRLTELGVEYDNADGEPEFYYVERLSTMIEPHSSFTLNNRSALSHSEPALLVARVIGVRFEGGRSWGEVPADITPPPAPPPAPGETTAEAASRALSRVPAIHKSGGGFQTSVITRVQPTYPPLAKAAQVSGAVEVEVLVDEDGNVAYARALSGHDLLKSSAVDAARGWKFSPTLLNGNAVQVIGTITMNFSL